MNSLVVDNNFDSTVEEELHHSPLFKLCVHRLTQDIKSQIEFAYNSQSVSDLCEMIRGMIDHIQSDSMKTRIIPSSVRILKSTKRIKEDPSTEEIQNIYDAIAVCYMFAIIKIQSRINMLEEQQESAPSLQKRFAQKLGLFTSEPHH